MSDRVRIWAVPALAVLGLADAAYLAVLHWIGEIPPCGGYSGCADVNNSPYAEIFGVPVAALGSLLYAAILGVGLWRSRVGGTEWANATLLLHGLVLAAAGFMGYLTAIELFVLHALCYWCLALATITLLLLILVARDVWAVGARSAPARAWGG